MLTTRQITSVSYSFHPPVLTNINTIIKTGSWISGEKHLAIVQLDRYQQRFAKQLFFLNNFHTK